ncbi:ribonuclease III [Cyanobium sp. Cruz CV13-4-11]|jgi:ribonuclease III|uniref:ribonuclease III n=1 Tax=unclassified Cyanobium TaxID=2627006 RepID=UPI0020CB8C50|nr:MULTISPECIES: ribonuclease III [unclassified Cyanobium]MCP9901245.1 ribonuclease III [Cyanobium sp. Cruz CV11-17]MCP9920135.1 ribonuclease III [Cyanobium sp. Cruz CV13-4-11]
MTPQRRQQLLAFLVSLGFSSGNGLLPLDAAAADAALASIDEALTHSSTGLPRHHDRLEFLGDAVLRLAAAEFLRSAHPSLSVGDSSALRAQLVSDRWLSDLARAIALEPVLLLGAMATGDRAGRATVLAECCEALVGAIYSVGGGPQGGLVAVQHWLAPHWQASAAELLADPLRHNWKSALQEWSQGQGQGLPSYHCQERSRVHGDPERFECRVEVAGLSGEGRGGSRREAEQQAARAALETFDLRPTPGC